MSVIAADNVSGKSPTTTGRKAAKRGSKGGGVLRRRRAASRHEAVSAAEVQPAVGAEPWRDAAAEWHEVRGEVALAYTAARARTDEKSGAAPVGRRLRELLARLDRAEALLVRHTPLSLSGVAEYLEIAEEILSERQTDPDGLMGAGPALEILCQVRKAVLELEDLQADEERDAAA